MDIVLHADIHLIGSLGASEAGAGEDTAWASGATGADGYHVKTHTMLIDESNIGDSPQQPPTPQQPG